MLVLLTELQARCGEHHNTTTCLCFPSPSLVVFFFSTSVYTSVLSLRLPVAGLRSPNSNPAPQWLVLGFPTTPTELVLPEEARRWSSR